MIGVKTEPGSYAKIYSMVLIAVFAALTCVGGFIRIPMYPVPFTLQTLFVYLSGLLLGAQRGVLSQLLFLIMGLAGIPVFAQGGGPAYVLQPSFGYLAAFPVSAYVCGKIFSRMKNARNFLNLLLACGTGAVLILSIGSAYLYFILNYIAKSSTSFRETFISGFILFLPAEAVKCFITVIITSKILNISALNDGI